MKSIRIPLAAFFIFHFAFLVTADAGEWDDAFRSPRDEHRPWTFWYWMYGCVGDEGIRLDLQAMKEAGIAGFYLMPIKDTTDGKATAEQLAAMGQPDYFTSSQLSGEWWRRMDTVMSTADSLGLKMGIHFSDGFALGGGPWITPEESMQRIVWADTIVEPKDLQSEIDRLKLPAVSDSKSLLLNYEDIAVFAYPAEYADDRVPTCNVEFPLRSSEPCNIVMSYDEPFTLRSVKVITGGNNYQAHRLKVYALRDGKQNDAAPGDIAPVDDENWFFVREISPARQGWQNTDAYATYSIPATTSTRFLFHWTPEGSDPGSEDMDAAKWKPNLRMANLILSSEPVVDGYEGKSGIVWRVSKEFPVDSTCRIPFDSVIDLTPFFLKNTDGESLLASSVSESTVPNIPHSVTRWHLLRMGHASTGHTNATGGGGKGLECDKFSRAAIDKQFDNWFAAIYNHFPPDKARRVLKRLHIDSWECGSQNWGERFAEEFLARRGYDLRPWLPVYAGVPMFLDESSQAWSRQNIAPDASSSVLDAETVLRDIRRTIAELIDEVFFDEFEKLGRQYGCEISEECVAPTMVSDGLLHYRHADYPMGEFWLNSPTHDKPNDMLDAVSGAHIYGKNIIQAEGFTEVRGTWDEHPGALKTLLDRNYCLGINSIVFHVNTHNPYTDLKPGMTLDGIGTFFQRDNTWWREMPAFTDYITRCQALLQYGSPVVDIAVYTGDETPRRAILPERLTTTLPGLLGEETLERERVRMLNVGQPLEVSPVGVTHTLNMTKAEQWINPLRGYRYDSFNHDVLDGAHVDDGCIVTEGGMRYRVLVLPQARPMNPDRLMTCDSIVDALKAQGATVIDEPWTAADLSSIGIRRDAALPAGIDYTHRHGPEADIYFLSNQTDTTVAFAPRFRDAREFACMANPMDGKLYTLEDEIVMLPGASLFVVYTDSETAGLNKEAVCASEMRHLETVNDAFTSRKWGIYFEQTGLSVKTNELFDWSGSADDRIKYYSGHAAYTTTFKYKSTVDGRVMLDLGDVRDIATVYVNDSCCGTAWTAPYTIDITDAVKKGTNTLRIDVVNTWANALLGSDLGTPPFEGIWTNGKYRRADKSPLPAGLIGPMELRVKN